MNPRPDVNPDDILEITDFWVVSGEQSDSRMVVVIHVAGINIRGEPVSFSGWMTGDSAFVVADRIRSAATNSDLDADADTDAGLDS